MGCVFQIEGITSAEAQSWELLGLCGELKGYYKSGKGQGELLGDDTGKRSQRGPGQIVNCLVWCLVNDGEFLKI